MYLRYFPVFGHLISKYSEQATNIIAASTKPDTAVLSVNIII